MKKNLFLFTWITAFLLLNSATFGQSDRHRTGKPVSASLSELVKAGFHKDGLLPSTTALFDVQSYYNLDSLASFSGGFAALAWTGSEWWVAQWNKDSLFTFSPAGVLTSSFKITGVGASNSGVRSMTFDGTYLYLADNSAPANIKKVDPVTKTLVSTISVSSTFTVRTATYSPLTNGGAGGFWISNFGSPLVEIDLAGNVLNSVPLSVHTLVAVYGLAMDTLTAGGPYLWAFDQAAGGTQANLVRLQLPSCIPTFVLHNVNSDIGVQSGSTGIAGGLFISSSVVPGENTIAGVLQGTPDDILFAYELDSASQIANDASLDTMRWQPGFTIVPDQQAGIFTFPAIATNRGANLISTLTYTAEVTQGASVLYTGSGNANAMASGSYALISPSGTWTPPGIGTYRVGGEVSIVGTSDQNPSNDTLSFRINVSDTVYARDNGVVNGALGIGSNIGGTLGQLYTLNSPDVITSVTFRCNGPTENDTTRVVIYNFAGSAPGTMIGKSDFYYFSASDTNGVVLTLEVKDMSGNPLTLGPGTYFVGIEEYFENVSLATSNFNWRPAVTYITFPGQAWASNEAFGFKRIYVLRANTGNSVTALPEFDGSDALQVFPNPARDRITLSLERGLFSYALTDLNGRVLEQRMGLGGKKEVQLSTDKMAVGVYQIRAVDQQGQVYLTRFVKQ
ncbi:MAG: T9SS type A sorting domain-containing protein [Bacteroidia bacterium]|nr:T9SS type A sorting domain-containing protein [Bacteroidia bacterium]